MVNKDALSVSEYQKAHRPATEFATRSEYLNNELQIMRPKRWRLNLPKRDYNFELEDLVPAIAGTIGKCVLLTAVVAPFAAGFGLPREFIAENVRFELLIAAILFVIPISGFLNPRANLPGCHGPMIPLIAMIVAAGGHPLALGVLIGLFGFAIAVFKGGTRLVNLTGASVRAGLLIVLGFQGFLRPIASLREWTIGIGREPIFFVILFAVIVIYAYLARIGKRWLSIPVCTATALTIALIMGAPLKFISTPGIVNLNPAYWWGADTGWMLGLPNLQHFIAVLPFALLAIAMWPPDFLSHRIFQEVNFPKGSEKAQMHVDDTMLNCSIRQVVGSFLGGGNITSSWGTYMIPSAIAKRPIPGGAIFVGIGCIAASVLGFPIDIAVWYPVLVVALLVGVFLPLLEAGMAMVRTQKEAEGAGICIFASVLVNPVFGWAVTMMLDNAGMIDGERSRSLNVMDRYVIPIVVFIVCVGTLAATGLIPGIPPLL